MEVIIYLAVVAAFFGLVRGEGAMYDPPSRSSMWRFGFNNLINYDDHSLTCGTYDVQWNENGGKCGICGDSYSDPTPRANEIGGTYGNSTIVKEYVRGQIIDVVIHLSASHSGYFTFSICDLAFCHEKERCFKQLLFADGSDKFEDVVSTKTYNLRVKLPKYLTCKHCVLRWEYTAGNNHGLCEDGTSALGCGPQETTRNCADIRIHYKH